MRRRDSLLHYSPKFRAMKLLQLSRLLSLKRLLLNQMKKVRAIANYTTGWLLICLSIPVAAELKKLSATGPAGNIEDFVPEGDTDDWLGSDAPATVVKRPPPSPAKTVPGPQSKVRSDKL